MSESINLFQIVTLCIASVGAVLGVINTWQALDKSRVKLRVLPKFARLIGGNDPRIDYCIEVINLSSFAVTVDEVGAFHQGTDKRSAWVRPIFHDGGGGWPRRLEPRTSLTAYGSRPQPLGEHPVRCVYASTACGTTREARLPAPLS